MELKKKCRDVFQFMLALKNKSFFCTSNLYHLLGGNRFAKNLLCGSETDPANTYKDHYSSENRLDIPTLKIYNPI